MLARNVLAHVRREVDGVPVSNLFDNGGKLGEAHHEERRVIRAWLDKKYGRLEPHTWDWTARELGKVNAIQRRLHRYDLTFRELQVLYKRKWARTSPPPPPAFTVEELEHLAELLGDANHPLSASIGAKAALMIGG